MDESEILWRHNYYKAQVVTGLSHEKDNNKWSFGQRRFVDWCATWIDKENTILDCACGDGIGLQALMDLELDLRVVGVELNPAKAFNARGTGAEVYEDDMHDLSRFPDNAFDMVLSSHTLEHAHTPSDVLIEFWRILKPHGLLFVVLPFPDYDSNHNDEIHCGKFSLGTNQDEPEVVIENLRTFGCFEDILWITDNFREPEIWVALKAKADANRSE